MKAKLVLQLSIAFLLYGTNLAIAQPGSSPYQDHLTYQAGVGIQLVTEDSGSIIKIVAENTAASKGLMVDGSTDAIASIGSITLGTESAAFGTAGYFTDLDIDDDLTVDDDFILTGDLGSESTPSNAGYFTDLDVDDDLTVDDDFVLVGDLSSEATPATAGYFLDLDVDDDLTVDDDFVLVGDLSSEATPANAGYFLDLDVDDDLTVDDDSIFTDDSVFGATSVNSGALSVVSIVGDAGTQEQFSLVQASADTTGGYMRFFKTRAATSAPTTIVVAGDEVGRLSFRGADGTNYDEGARIRAVVATGVDAGTDMPMELVFSTSPDGSATVTDKLLLHSYNDLDLLGDFGLAGTTANGSDTGSFTFCPAGGISGGVGGGNCSGGRAAVLVISGADDTTADATAGSVDIRTSDTNGSKIKLRPNGATNIVEYTDADNGKMNWGHTCVTETIDSAAATETITAVIPARAVSLGISCRVDTILAGAGLTTWSLGDGVDADLYGTTLALAAGTTVGTSNYTASPMTQVWSTSAGNLTMTAAAGQFDSGVVTCCSHWFTHTGPTS